MFTVPLPRNCHIYWLNYSGFHPSFHNTLTKHHWTLSSTTWIESTTAFLNFLRIILILRASFVSESFRRSLLLRFPVLPPCDSHIVQVLCLQFHDTYQNNSIALFLIMCIHFSQCHDISSFLQLGDEMVQSGSVKIYLLNTWFSHFVPENVIYTYYHLFSFFTLGNWIKYFLNIQFDSL